MYSVQGIYSGLYGRRRASLLLGGCVVCYCNKLAVAGELLCDDEAVWHIANGGVRGYWLYSFCGHVGETVYTLYAKLTDLSCVFPNIFKLQIAPHVLTL